MSLFIFNFKTGSAAFKSVPLFLIKLSWFVPLIAAVVISNLLLDPAYLFKSNHSYENGIATILAEGKIAANVTNYDERLVQKLYCEKIKQKNDVLVIGSSRVMQIGVNVISRGGRLFNNSVSGASLEDILALFHMYEKREFKPNRLILGIDPWLFNRYSGQGRYASILDDYLIKKNELLSTSFSPKSIRVNHKWLQLFSPSYFQSSLLALWSRVRQKGGLADAPRGKYFSVETLDKLSPYPYSAILADGRYFYEEKVRLATSDEVRASALSYASGKSVYSLDNYRELDPALKDLFEKFLTQLKKSGVLVQLILPPYHPISYQHLIGRNDTQIITRVEDYVRQVAAALNLQVFGSYNPRLMGLDETDFFDGMHPKDVAWIKYFKSFNEMH